MIPGIELAACGPLAVPHEVMAHVVQVESSRNPFAIGVVGGRLLRQPRDLAEAAATVRMLEANGHNYSIGLAQVNRINFARFGLDTPEKGFDVCNNLAAGAKILAECLQRHDGRWGDAFSCYYSGNARTGYEHGYVQKVFGAMAAANGGSGDAQAIPLAPRRNSDVSNPPGTSATEPPNQTGAPNEGWGAIFAARINAPDASRAQRVAKAEPVTATGSFVSVTSPEAGAETDESATVTMTGSAASTVAPVDTLGMSPEARLVMEMQQRVSEQTATATSQSPPEAPRPDGETVVNNQQSSNSHAKDAARVF